MIEIETIASSSKGNCYKISDGKTTLMIECGLRLKQIQKAFNFELSGVLGCLISHEHSDHSKSVKQMMKAGIDCYMSEGTSEALNLYSHRLKTVKSKKSFKIGTFAIMAFDTQHDSKEPIGFLIQSGKEKILFATDTFYLKYKFKKLTHIMIECNYSKEILDKNVEDGKVSLFLKDRIVKSHFSLENLKEFFEANDLSECKEIHLLHLSNNNSNPELFKNEIQKLTGIPVYIRG